MRNITVYILFNDETLPSDLGNVICSLKNENVIVKTWYNTGSIRHGVSEVIKDCETEFLSFVDSDDIIVAGIYEKMLTVTKDNTDFSYCDEIMLNVVTGKVTTGFSESKNPKAIIENEPNMIYFWDDTNEKLSHHRGIFRTRSIKNVLFDYNIPDIFCQGELIHHIQRHKKNNIVYLNEVGYIWRIHGNNATIKYLKGKES